MDDLQRKTARAIVNIFETGRVAGDYGAVTVLKGDSGHLTYGRSQTTLGSGNLFLLIRAYTARSDAQFGNELKPFETRLRNRDVSLDRDGDLREILHAAGDDLAMRDEQNRFFDAHYFNPALTIAVNRGITSSLGQTVVYDSTVHGGFSKVVARMGVAIGGAIDEREWIRRYIAARRDWLKSLPDPLPKTIYRMEAFDKMVGANAWDLPLDLKVRGVTISPDNLDDPAPVVRATAVDPGDPPEPATLVRTSPFMRGDDVRRVQDALRANGFEIASDGIYGHFTEALVRKFQASKGLRADGVVGQGTRAALGL